MAKYTKEQVEAAVKSKGYVWFEGAKDYDVNIVGVRNAATGQTDGGNIQTAQAFETMLLQATGTLDSAAMQTQPLALAL